MHGSRLVFLSHIPIVIWVFCAVLLLGFLWQLLAMQLSRNRLRKKLRTLTSALRDLTDTGRRELQSGLNAEQLDAYRVALDKLDGLPREWWERIDHSIALYIDQEEREGWYLTERPRNLLPYDAVISQNFHAAIFGAVPGILTGLGLTGTFLAILVAITAPSGFVSTLGAAIIGFVAGILVCLSCAFVENYLKVDDPVGAVSVHGTCGLWGVLSIGFFADGTSNYGGAWNGVNGSVTGLFYGDASQLVAQIVGCATLVGFVFTFSFVLNWILDAVLGQRVSIETEVAGLDLPEMGQLGYPEFVFRPEPEVLLAAERLAVATA